MKNTRRAVGLLLLLLALVSCDAEVKSRAAAVYPDQNSEGFRQFSVSCSHCHLLPQPSLYHRSAWSTVVYRMQKHRQQRGMGRMSLEEEKVVLAYLMAHSKKDELR